MSIHAAYQHDMADMNRRYLVLLAENKALEKRAHDLEDALVIEQKTVARLAQRNEALRALLARYKAGLDWLFADTTLLTGAVWGGWIRRMKAVQERAHALLEQEQEAE